MRKVFTLLFPVVFVSSFAISQDTVQVKTGWNLIGSVIAGAVPEILFTIPDSLIISSYWGYNPGVGYESTDTLVNGTGYWVKAISDGQIVFNNAPPVDSCKSKAFIYEGKLYHTVLIGNQCWMAENLDVGVMIDSLLDAMDNDTIEKYCYRNDPNNCTLYGGLFQWNEVMQYVMTEGARGICPMGWHIPTLNEYLELRQTVHGEAEALKVLGEGSATNTSGFSALLGGYRHTDSRFYLAQQTTFFWTSTEYGPTPTDAGFIFLENSDYFIKWNYSKKVGGLSVRCIED